MICVPGFGWSSLTKLVSCLFIGVICLGAASAQTKAECDDAAYGASIMTASEHTHHDKRILMLSGEFDRGAHDRVEDDIRNTRRYDEVWMCSPGGNVEQGKRIGVELVKARATVRVPGNFRCVSSCTIAFLGGFIRIIEPEAKYLVHASSGFRVTNINTVVPLNCATLESEQICKLLIALANSASLNCRSVEDLQDPTVNCALYDETRFRGGKFIAFRLGLLDTLPINERLLRIVTDNLAAQQVGYTADLMMYYQQMLLGRSKPGDLESRYAQIQNRFTPLSIYDPANYDPTNFGTKARTLSNDIRQLNTAKKEGRYQIWQSIFTNIELTVQRQFVEYIQDNKLSFGPASGDALKIMDAMLVCQIQSVCQLEVEHAKDLGIHNVFDAQ